MTFRWEAIPFALFTLVLALTATYTLVLGIRGTDGLRIGFAAIQYGLGVTTGYEAAALWFEKVPTISHITNAALLAHPFEWMVCFLVIMVASGALSAHFSVQHKSVTWLVVVLGITAFIAGAGITAVFRWNP